MASKLQTLMLMLTTSIIIMTCVSALQPSHHHFRIGLPVLTTTTTSTISASPSYLIPDTNASPSPLSPSSASSPTPSYSAAFSPDVTPLLPSPGPDSALSPSGSSIIPTIPSNPSPPNPESILAPQPLMASSPTGLMFPDSSALHLELTGSVFLSGLLALWLVQI